MKKIVWVSLLAMMLLSCGDEYNGKKALTAEQYDALLIKLAPYVNKKPDEFSFEKRFAKSSIPYYKQIVERTGAEVRYFLHTDTANFFFYNSRDKSSLYEHYRGLGGYYKITGDSITFLNLLYHTPRLTKEEMGERGKELFEAMTTKGNVDAFIGNRKYIHTPNNDFYYDTKSNRWDYTENSSWKFMQDAKDQAEQSSKAEP